MLLSAILCYFLSLLRFTYYAKYGLKCAVAAYLKPDAFGGDDRLGTAPAVRSPAPAGPQAYPHRRGHVGFRRKSVLFNCWKSGILPNAERS